MLTQTRLVSTGPDSREKPSVSGSLGKHLGVGVVFAQPLDVVLHGVERGRGKDARLAHPAAEQLSEASRLADRLGRTGQRRANGRPQSLREADRDGVEMLGPFAGRACRSRRRRSSAGHRRGASPGGSRGPSGGSRRCSRASGPALRRDCACSPARRAGFERNGRRRGGWLLDLFEGKQPEVALKRPRRHAGKPRDATRLPDIDVRGRRAQEFVSRAGVHADGDLVGHRSRRHEDRGFLAQELRRAGLERVDGRVSPKTSSPTSASAIALRIAGVGLVTVSDLRSIGGRFMSVLSASIRDPVWIAPVLAHSDIDCFPLCPEGQPDHGKATCGTGHGILVWVNNLNLRRSWCSQWVACCKVGLDRPLIPTTVVANLFRSARVSR